eukprot:TRINITY_DN46789_c0_g1_i1.p2 TRINITY_DN46789_c0_g1~~TRINITY_DN46789_c0_g1_i1.p2  ORF type:complete len:153 (+),score=51.25 TRINITY_DN46789_c0_g1_i1:28-459(+)
MKHSRQVSLSSLPLQASLVLSLVAAALWLVSSIITWVYKGIVLPYPEGAWPAEIFLMLAIFMLELLSRSLAARGNLLEYRGPIFAAALLSTVEAAGLLYFLRFQPYVVKLDLYLSAVFMAVKGLSVLLMVYQLWGLSFVAQTL